MTRYTKPPGEELFERDGKTFVSPRVAAIICGVSWQTYKNWARDDKPPPRDAETGCIPLDELGDWIRSVQVLKRGRGGGGFPYMPNMKDLYESVGIGKESPESRLRRLQADKVELELNERRQQLISADDVADGWRKILGRVRTRLLKIPVAVAPMVTGNDDIHDVQDRIMSGVREALEELADGDRKHDTGSDTLGSDIDDNVGEVVNDGTGTGFPVAPS